ncbi:hypothetical protein OAC87_07065 [Pseudomonadales bacterium]|nr:hypothetical protein [Pseudomonadales bacterium]
MAERSDLFECKTERWAGAEIARNSLVVLALLLLTACSSKPYEPAPVDEIRPGIRSRY